MSFLIYKKTLYLREPISASTLDLQCMQLRAFCAVKLIKSESGLRANMNNFKIHVQCIKFFLKTRSCAYQHRAKYQFKTR